MTTGTIIRFGAGLVAGVFLWAEAVSARPEPPLPPAGRADYADYLEAPDHAAFAIAPGGAWGWVSGQLSLETAREGALAACQANTSQRCVLYGEDGQVVFDAKGWPHLWGPYASAADAARVMVGRQRGQRMADLAFADAGGKGHKLSDYLGKVVVLHFWGAWCPPCRREMPDLQKLHDALEGRRDVVFLPLQVREKFDASRRWAAAQGLRLSLYDSGSSGDMDTELHLAGGRAVADRDIASRFPTTYVLDKRGVIVFVHVGPVYDWPQYEPFLRDVAERSAAK